MRIGRRMRLLMLASSVLILAGVMMMGWLDSTEDERNVIEVQLKMDETHSVQFESLALLPGDSCEYTVKLKKEGAAQYDLRLRFVELEEKTLKNFAYVRITSGEETVCDELLATVLEDDGIVLPVDFNKGKNTELKIVYYLPIEVGNEAKNAEALFELKLTAINE